MSRQKIAPAPAGDVGAGKPSSALFAALLAMENGYQSAIMAPPSSRRTARAHVTKLLGRSHRAGTRDWGV